MGKNNLDWIILKLMDFIYAKWICIFVASEKSLGYKRRNLLRPLYLEEGKWFSDETSIYFFLVFPQM